MTSLRFETLAPRIMLHGESAVHAADTHHEDPNESNVVVVGEAEPSVAAGGHQDSAAHGAESDSNPHGNDHVQGQEHQVLFDLVPHGQATHVAAANGSWSDASTWQGGAVPGDDSHVLIPDGTQVTLASELTARLATIRVDGLLRFAADVDTAVLVDTFVIGVSGRLEIGTSAQPITADVSARVLFTDGGAIDASWDPTLLSRGLISHGAVSIFGADKGAPIKLETPPMAGDTQLHLASPAEGWRVGDRVLTPGVVRPTENNNGVTLVDEDEVVTITAISPDGRTVSVDHPFAYDHAPPREDLSIPIANLDRNVVFSSENTTDPSRAGHVMFMHSADATVNHAAFRHIGRNDKSIPTTDPEVDEHGTLVAGTGDNARGRYAVHFHRTGSESIAATVTGSVVENAPGWGFVNHDSHVVVRDSVSYNVKGAGFVTEVGSERGAFVNNLAVRSVGKNFYQPAGASDKGAGNGFGSAGHGFWLQSAGVAMIGNVAAGHAQEGIFINNRLITEPGREGPTLASLVDVAAGTPVNFVPGSPESGLQGSQLPIEDVPLAEMRGNEVFASGAGLAVRWRRPIDAATEGDDGDVFEDFKIWNVNWAGIHLGYVTGLTLRDGLILGDADDPIALGNSERLNRGTETSEHRVAVGKGVFANRNSRDVTYEELEVAGFAVGIEALTQSLTTISSVRLQNIENLVITTPQATSQSAGFRRVDARDVENVPLDPAALDGATPYNVRFIKQLDRAGVAGGSTNSQEFDSFTTLNEIYYNGHRLYFHDQHLDATPFPSAEAPAFMDSPAYDEFLDVSNDELRDDFRIVFGGEIADDSAFDAYESLGANGLAIQVDPPPPPAKVIVRFDETSADFDWEIGGEVAGFGWSTFGVDPNDTWRVYLSGANGDQEIGRSQWPEEYGHVAAGPLENGWQQWRFDWPEVGDLPPWEAAPIAAGDYSLVTVAGDGTSIYLGRVSVSPAAAASRAVFIPFDREPLDLSPGLRSVPRQATINTPHTGQPPAEEFAALDAAYAQSAAVEPFDTHLTTGEEKPPTSPEWGLSVALSEFLPPEE